MSRILPLFFLLTGLLCGCNKSNIQIPEVTADAETEASLSNAVDDAADDPAIWIHPTDSSQSVIIGAIKGFGLEVYDLAGKRLHSYPTGKPNNVDIRYAFPLVTGAKVDVIACSERTTNEILIYGIKPSDRSLYPLNAGSLKSSVDEVYGFCLYQSAIDSQYYAFVNGKDGQIEQWKLLADSSGGIHAELARKLKVATQPEGMVADDALAVLYVGEENKGIWKFKAEPGEGEGPVLVAMSTQENPTIQYDIEGLAIFPTGRHTGFLLASSQGNNSYAVFDRQAENRYLGSFSIGNTGSVDGTYDTDGIDVTAANLGGSFGQGLFVAQDGANTDVSGKPSPQNFKLVGWQKIMAVIPVK